VPTRIAALQTASVAALCAKAVAGNLANRGPRRSSRTGSGSPTSVQSVTPVAPRGQGTGAVVVVMGDSFPAGESALSNPDVVHMWCRLDLADLSSTVALR
jgi:hypothetical protein